MVWDRPSHRLEEILECARGSENSGGNGYSERVPASKSDDRYGNESASRRHPLCKRSCLCNDEHAAGDPSEYSAKEYGAHLHSRCSDTSGNDIEICDGVDNDCNGPIDDGLTFDVDGDGYTTPGSCAGTQNDCDDEDISNFPGNVEVCDGSDNDCDTVADNGLTFDDDGDGFTSLESCEGSMDDCDDTDPANFPGNTEVRDGSDNVCNGLLDEGHTFDLDGDGHSTLASCEDEDVTDLTFRVQDCVCHPL